MLKDNIDTYKEIPDNYIPGGFVLKARRIKDSTISSASPCTRETWSWLLLNANYQDRSSKGYMVKRGQLFCRYADIRNSLAWYIGYRKVTYSESQMKTSIKILSNEGMITTTKHRLGVMITICNYDKYQSAANYEQTDEWNIGQTTKPPAQNPNSPDKKQKRKKVMKKNKITKEAFLFPSDWPEILIKKFEEYLQHRKEINKAITPTAFRKQITFIEKESGGDLKKTSEIIDQSIRNSWTGLFPLNKKTNNFSNSNMDAVKEFING